MAAGRIRIGIGGWSFPPWRGVFYPKGLAQARELGFASRAVSTIEINGTYYSTFSRETWRKWRAQTPDDFMFSVKASRFATNRKRLDEAGPAIAKFLGQGMAELGDKLGPINWQLAATKRFDAEEMEAFLHALPREIDGLSLRHAVEVRHDSFTVPKFAALARKYKVAIVYAESPQFPCITKPTAPFTYARIMTARESLQRGLKSAELAKLKDRVSRWARRGDVFIYFIAAAKVRNPAAAKSLIELLGSGGTTAPRRLRTP